MGALNFVWWGAKPMVATELALRCRKFPWYFRLEMEAHRLGQAGRRGHSRDGLNSPGIVLRKYFCACVQKKQQHSHRLCFWLKAWPNTCIRLRSKKKSQCNFPVGPRLLVCIIWKCITKRRLQFQEKISSQPKILFYSDASQCWNTACSSLVHASKHSRMI